MKPHFKSSLVVIAVVFLAGCYAKMLTYNGAAVTKPADIVRLQSGGGEQKGQWKTDELSINYRMETTPETLKISGNVKLVGGFAIGFREIDRLAVQLLFLNSQGIVVDTVFLYSPDNHHETDLIPMNFEEIYKIPAGAAAVSFAYDGRLSDNGGRTAVDIGYSP